MVVVSPSVILFLVWVDGVCVCVCWESRYVVAVIIFSLVCTMNMFWRPRPSDLALWELLFAYSTSCWYSLWCISPRTFFGAMQITRELCFDEGGMMVSFREWRYVVVLCVTSPCVILLLEWVNGCGVTICDIISSVSGWCVCVCVCAERVGTSWL